jgi:hypothetical protein
MIDRAVDGLDTFQTLWGYESDLHPRRIVPTTFGARWSNWLTSMGGNDNF